MTAGNDENKVVEIELERDDEDELDGWGPVRVRRSSIPAASSNPSVPPLIAAPAPAAAEGQQTQPLQAPERGHNPKQVLS